ncbi:hypothetical protein [Neisseria animalis]|uniref:Uncharacterized protein n=1 Tax=Neisseria animalis TaxID=492 RepID=A0A5P3MUN3_NEIAN|nr:hypothetical protein [Neisseria animalis]QEY24369.1 hypothetical protein D0T90_07680 [Neisseria animalis]ROW31721.1 hypothetical protein CGZ60_08605 [Neisseria animalis]
MQAADLQTALFKIRTRSIKQNTAQTACPSPPAPYPAAHKPKPIGLCHTQSLGISALLRFAEKRA